MPVTQLLNCAGRLICLLSVSGKKAFVAAISTRRFTADRILETDHRNSVGAIIEHHGESVAGHVFQDLLAYLVGYAGYKDVILNAVGVPDATVSGFAGRTSVQASSAALGPFTADEARRLVEYCEQVGDEELAARIRAWLELKR